MDYKDSFGETVKIRLSSGDYESLKKLIPLLKKDSGIKALAEAVITEYDQRRSAYEKTCADMSNEVTSDYCTAFTLYIPQFLKKDLNVLIGLDPSLKDFVEQF